MADRRGTLTDTDVLFFLLTPGSGMCLVGGSVEYHCLEQATLPAAGSGDQRGNVWATAWLFAIAFGNSVNVPAHLSLDRVFVVICSFCRTETLGKHDINFISLNGRLSFFLQSELVGSL